MSGGGAPPKRVWTVADGGVVTVDDRPLSCHGIQRMLLPSAGRSVRLTSLVLDVASILAGAVIHEGNVVFVFTRSSSEGASSGGPAVALTSASVSRACSGPSSRIFLNSVDESGWAKSVFVKSRFS